MKFQDPKSKIRNLFHSNQTRGLSRIYLQITASIPPIRYLLPFSHPSTHGHRREPKVPNRTPTYQSQACTHLPPPTILSSPLLSSPAAGCSVQGNSAPNEQQRHKHCLLACIDVAASPPQYGQLSVGDAGISLKRATTNLLTASSHNGH